MSPDLRRRIKKWYEGTDVEPTNDPRSRFVILHTGKRRRHWTANAARTIVTFVRSRPFVSIVSGVVVALIVAAIVGT